MLWRYRSTVFGLLMCALIGVGVAVANAHALDPVSTADDVRLSFTDGAGDPTVVPYFSVAGAYPGMRRQLTTATLANPSSTVTIAYDLSVIVTRQDGASSLSDVVVATVSRQGSVVYHGPLSQLLVKDSPPLAPNASASFRIALSWPDGGSSDNQYQGTSLSFDLIARSRQAK